MAEGWRGGGGPPPAGEGSVLGARRRAAVDVDSARLANRPVAAEGKLPVSTQNQGTPDLAAVTSAGRPGLSVGTLVGDRYEIVRLLGEGGMGSVYEARHKILGRHVAIKVLKPVVALNEGLVARFLQEAKAAAELHHKNIVELTATVNYMC